ncbi:hypothetical protein BD289DRAFT_49045 [Coniella lustricola]|uniref:Uncharacterized protein n=1 Tax=Coniella lustricola TaxID=2025994 RepID=A0A2T3AIJ2_9PEZI|nr:hypothetical protein BD289DRAFT_49045 [Coniella lustricola]
MAFTLYHHSSPHSTAREQSPSPLRSAAAAAAGGGGVGFSRCSRRSTCTRITLHMCVLVCGFFTIACTVGLVIYLAWLHANPLRAEIHTRSQRPVLIHDGEDQSVNSPSPHWNSLWQGQHKARLHAQQDDNQQLQDDGDDAQLIMHRDAEMDQPAGEADHRHHLQNTNSNPQRLHMRRQLKVPDTDDMVTTFAAESEHVSTATAAAAAGGAPLPTKSISTIPSNWKPPGGISWATSQRDAVAGGYESSASTSTNVSSPKTTIPSSSSSSSSSGGTRTVSTPPNMETFPTIIDGVALSTLRTRTSTLYAVHGGNLVHGRSVDGDDDDDEESLSETTGTAATTTVHFTEFSDTTGVAATTTVHFMEFPDTTGMAATTTAF